MSDSLVNSLLMAGKKNEKVLNSIDKHLEEQNKTTKKATQDAKAREREQQQMLARLAGDKKKEGKQPDYTKVLEENNTLLKKLLGEQKKGGKGGGNNPLGSAAGGALGGGIAAGALKALGAIPWLAMAKGATALGGMVAALKGLEWLGNFFSGVKDGKQVKTSVSQEMQFGDSADTVAAIQRDREESKKPFRGSRGGMSNDYRRRGGNETAMQQGFITPEEQDSQRRVYELLFKDVEDEKNERIEKEATTYRRKPGRSGAKESIVDEEKKKEIIADYEKKKAGLVKRYEETFGPLNQDIQRRQSGGPITVPGSGSGDKVPMMLPPGSFVLNRNASNFLRRQSGGEVPTMLEPGELVYLNENIPRFQTGGEVSKNPPQGKDSTPPPSSETSKVGKTGVFFRKDADIAPGGKMTFTGDGSGFTGEVKLIDGMGKVVAQIGGVSGVARTANASQEERSNVSGTLNPLPDGNYPLETQTQRHPGQTVGEWSAWINNPSGQVGKRGQLYVHNDIGSDGTAGCIGVEAGGSRGSKNSMMFAEMYDKVQPKNVSVNLASSSGGTYAPGGSPGENGKSGEDGKSDGGKGILGNLGDMALGAVGGATFGAMASKVFAEELEFFSFLGIPPAAITTLIGAAVGAAGVPGLNLNLENLTSTFSGGNFGGLNGGGDGNSGQVSTSQAGRQNSFTGDSAKSNKPYDIAASIGFSKEDWDIYRNVVGKIESGNKYDIAGGSGGHYDGRWQLGDAAKTDAASYLGEQYAGHGDAARKSFQKDADMQERYFAAFTAKNHSYLSGNPAYDKLSTREKFQVLGYAHNQGAGGASDWLATGEVRRDGFGTEATKYSKALAEAYGKQKGGVVGFQKGGMVPTMLEPGEKVFMPGQWNSNISALNDAIPRFQVGGAVGMSNMMRRGEQMVHDISMDAIENKNADPIMIQVPAVPAESGQVGDGVPSLPVMPAGPKCRILE